MTKTVTAIFRTHAVATTVRDKIKALGLSDSHVTILPDDPAPLAEGTHRTDDHVRRAHDLNVPDEDKRTYQQAIREGHFIVSADVDSDHVATVSDIMRHPDTQAHAIDFDAYETEYRGHADYDPALTPMTDTRTGTTTGAEHIGRRDDAYTGTLRAYDYDLPADERVRMRGRHAA